MLEDFLLANRAAILERARVRVRARVSPVASDRELASSIPIFLGQLEDALRLAATSDTVDHEAMSNSAARHGYDLLQSGVSVAQVVHDYGDVRHAISDIAFEQKTTLQGHELRVLNHCVDDAVAAAVTEFFRAHDRKMEDARSERLGLLAHEMRNHLNVAVLSFEIIKNGSVATGGSTSALHARSLVGLRDLINRSLADIRLEKGIHFVERIVVAELVEEVEIAALLQAKARGIHFVVNSLDRSVAIEGDRQILAAAVSNLLQNAFKFTRPDSHVVLTTRATEDRVLFEIEDECGGLPPGKPESLFLPFEQRNRDRSGLGLGLSICRKAAEASGGEIRVRDIPGKGCVFTLDLPRKTMPPLSIVGGQSTERGVPEASRSVTRAHLHAG